VCEDSPVVAASVRAENQISIRSLRECEEIEGDLVIDFAGEVDLTPLRRLRRIGGALLIRHRGQPSEIAPGPRLDSLAGLEGLTHTGGVWLDNLAVVDLAPLGGLSEIGPADPSLEVAGWLRVVSCPELSSLAGLTALERLEGIHLEHLPQIRLEEPGPTGTLGSLRLIDVPLARSIGSLRLAPSLHEVELDGVTLAPDSALSAVTSLDRLTLRGVDDYNVFPSLVSVGALILAGGPTDAANAFGSLERVQRLSIEGDQLSRLPTFPKLEPDSPIDLELSGADAITRLELPRLQRLGEVTICCNATLTEIDLRAVASAQALDIFDNPALETLRLDGLDSVDRFLRVVSNGSLSEANVIGLERLPESRVKIGANADPPLLRAPCPWSDDAVCDEGTVCAEGTDGQDCP
jgi:hypothetical protein